MQFVEVQAHYSAQVALEGITDIVDKSFNSMVTAISNFFPSIKTTFDGAIEAVSNLKPLSADVLNALSPGYGRSQAAELNLASFSKVTVRVPEGFSGNLHDYAEFLSRSWDFVHQEAVPQMDNLYGMLASFASNRSSKLSLTDTSRIFLGIDASYQELVKESKIYFGKERHNSTKSDIGTAYGEYHRALQCESRIQGLAKQLNPRQVATILDKIKRISSVLDIIIKDAQTNEYDKASYESVKSLATGVYSMAEAMEFFSITYYRITEMAVVCKDNQQVFKKLK